MAARFRTWLINILLLTSIVGIWILSIWIASGVTKPPGASLGDLAGLLFGAASVALFVLSFFVAILSILGWQTLQATVRERVRAAVEREIRTVAGRVDRLSEELTARNLTGLGFMVGELSHDFRSVAALDPDRLEYAVSLCREAYEQLEKIQAKEEVLLLALNNLVFYTSVLGKTSDATFALERAEILKRSGQRKKNATELLTYCRAVLCYSKDHTQIREAAAIVDELLGAPISHIQKKEASLYQTSFRPKLG